MEHTLTETIKMSTLVEFNEITREFGTADGHWAKVKNGAGTMYSVKFSRPGYNKPQFEAQIYEVEFDSEGRPMTNTNNRLWTLELAPAGYAVVDSREG